MRLNKHLQSRPGVRHSHAPGPVSLDKTHANRVKLDRHRLGPLCPLVSD
jgi:hypothetical protein